MEARIARWQDLLANPWSRVMDIVLVELRCDKKQRISLIRDGWVFYDLPRDLLRKRAELIQKYKSSA